MTAEQIIEMAIVYSTVGLHGADDFEFQMWRQSASPAELSIFAEIVDLIAEISEPANTTALPSKSVKTGIMKRIRSRKSDEHSPAPSSKPVHQAPGFRFVDADQGTWKELPVSGARIKELSTGHEMSMFLLELDPGTRMPSHHHDGVEEGFVISGDLHMCGHKIEAGGYMRAESGSNHDEIYSENGCRALIVTSNSNYPRKSIHLYDTLNNIWNRARKLINH